MRPIKFRGRRVDNGEYIYGGCVQIAHASTTYIVSDSDGSSGNYRHFYPVDSVAQLVGYDKNGKEVYEGDTLIVGKNGAEYVVDYRDPPDYIIWHSLKETSHD